MAIQLLLALVAGMLTIAAPCILLPLPIILGASVGQRNKMRPLFITLGFVFSFALVALVINFLIQELGLDPNLLRTLAVILLALFSLFMIWPAPFERLMTHASGLINKASQVGQTAGNGNLGGFVMGMIIGVVWAPCAGPILGSILTLVALQKNFLQASILLVAYALGAGIPMLGIAYGGQALTTRVKAIAQYSNKLQQLFGVVLLLLAGAIYFQYDTILQAKLVERFPTLSGGLEAKLKEKFTQTDEEKENSNSFPAPLTTKPTTTPPAGKTKLEDYGIAPEFTGIEKWLNSSPLTMQELRGKVVLIDFWTYSCINCVRTLPYVTKWYDTYKDKGFVVIGVHTPEFAFEKLTSNVETAIKRHGIHYPVAQDNNFGTWNAYQNEYWPAHYLIDQNGHVVYTHFGEGKYAETENTIRQLLGLDNGVPRDGGQNLSGIKSPEMYFGTRRLKNFTPGQKAFEEDYTYVIPNRLDLNNFALEGQWRFDADKVLLTKGPGKIKLHFHSGKVFIVASSATPQTIQAKVDGLPVTLIKIDGSNIYNLFDSSDYTDHVLEVTIPEAGFEAYTLTFG